MAKTGIGKTIIRLEIDNTEEIEINHIEAEEIIIETIDQIIEVDQYDNYRHDNRRDNNRHDDR